MLEAYAILSTVLVVVLVSLLFNAANRSLDIQKAAHDIASEVDHILGEHIRNRIHLAANYSEEACPVCRRGTA